MNTTIRTITAAALATVISLGGVAPAKADAAGTPALDDEVEIAAPAQPEADGVEYGAGLPDTDGDGIPDLWETEGVVLQDGTEIPLPDMGADPSRPDLFLQLNWMASEWETLKCYEAEKAQTTACAEANTKTYRPASRSLDEMVELFDAHGINLHIDAGDTYTNIPGYAQTYGGQTEDYVNFPFNGKPSGIVLMDNQARLLGARAALFRVGVIGDKMAPRNDASGTATTGRNSFYVAKIMKTEEQLRNTILHEFGHTLNLGHQGTKNETNDIDQHERAPLEYRSVMNYSHQLDGSFFNFSEEPYNYTGKHDARTVSADWDNLVLGNDWIGYSAAAIGARADQAKVAEEEAKRAALRAAEDRAVEVAVKDAPAAIKAGEEGEITVALTNPGLNLATYTVEASYPGGKRTGRVTLEGVGSERDNSAEITIPLTAPTNRDALPVDITVYNHNAVVADAQVNVKVEGANAVALAGENANKDTAKDNKKDDKPAQARTVDANTKPEAAKVKDTNVGAIIGAIVAVLAVLGLGAGAMMMMNK